MAQCKWQDGQQAAVRGDLMLKTDTLPLGSV